MLVGLAAAVALTVGAPAADARLREAGTVLPPGQSGYVSAAGVANGTGSPHLTDQTERFVAFGFKNALMGQPGTSQSPRGGVTIVRDGFGVPAITGASSDDLWFGVGYAMGEDRLFQLELFRRATRGRLAEILGRDYVEMDIRTRRDFYTDGELDGQLAKLSPELRARFDSLRDGINAYIAETRTDPSKLPGEFGATGSTPADWDVRDSAAIGVFLGRTVPSDDGEELNNARALAALGPDLFSRLIPIRAKDQIATIPRSEGLFPSNPGRTKRDEAKGFRRSQRYLMNITLPPQSAGGEQDSDPVTDLVGILGQHGGSNMWAIRGPNRTAALFNGPQLGFQIPELFIELELHGPGIDARGATAPGVPVLGLGHNNHVAWGVTSGLTDEDDLYVEQLTGPEAYRFKGKEERMQCRDETFSYRAPPSGLLGLDTGGGAGSQTERICRTVHGPVQLREGGSAFARRYAIWGREVETLQALAAVNQASSVKEIDRAFEKATWNENLMAADDRGNIGYWHPGLLPIKPRTWDERLPFPGTGEAEWRGLLKPSQRPHVINPRKGWLANWNNMPSAGWTQGDAPARERLSAKYHRDGFLARVVSRAHERGGGFERLTGVDKVTGTTAQQRPLAAGPLKRARRAAAAGSDAAIVLDTILRWNGSYHVVDQDGNVDPGLPAWESFKASAVLVALGQHKREDVDLLASGKGASHVFDVSNGEAYALRTLSAKGYRQAAKLAFKRLQGQFGSANPSLWRQPRRMYTPTAQGAGDFPPFPFFDRGTFQMAVELGP